LKLELHSTTSKHLCRLSHTVYGRRCSFSNCVSVVVYFNWMNLNHVYLVSIYKTLAVSYLCTVSLTTKEKHNNIFVIPSRLWTCPLTSRYTVGKLRSVQGPNFATMRSFPPIRRHKNK
jgi:hypothetical protein